MSEPATVTSGVPQGSILGPLLFIIYMNDMALEPEQTDLNMYADDSTLGATGDNVDLVKQKLGSDLGNIVNWCDGNKMAINYDKTKVMLLTTYQKYHTLSVKEIKITINNKTLENVEQQKLLGIVVDQNLS